MSQGGKKGRKVGRNKSKCQAYRLAGTREKNKARRIAKDNRRIEKIQARRSEFREAA